MKLWIVPNLNGIKNQTLWVTETVLCHLSGLNIFVKILRGFSKKIRLIKATK